MSLYSIPNLLVSIYTLALGVVVLLSNPKARKNQLCFLLTLFTFFWLFSYGIAYSTTNHWLAIILLKTGHVSATCITPVIYLFALEVLGCYRKRIDVVISRISILMLFFAIYGVIFSKLYIQDVVMRFWGYYLVGGPLMMFYCVFTFFIALRSIYLFYRASTQAQSEYAFENYQRFKYYCLSISLFLPACIDYIPKFGPNIYPLGFIFVAAFSSLITYAMAKHKLLDVDLLIKRGFTYSFLISIITILYLVLILISENLFRSFFGYQSIFIAIIAATLVSLTFVPLRVKIQRFVDKYFLKVDSNQLMKENSKLKDAVRQQDQMKAVATLAAGMAHEIKNPLTTIKTFASYLPEKYDDPEFRSKFSRLVTDEVDRVNNIVGQLLEFSKPKELDIKPGSIVSLLNETLDLLNSNLLKNKIQVQKDFLVNPSIPIDRNQLKQAFLNIFINSIQAMPNGGLLKVTTSLPENSNRLVVSIEDSGYGIPENQLQNIFDPFFTTREEGTGLGLSIVHGIISKHGGEIKVASLEKKGTTVSVLLKSRD